MFDEWGTPFKLFKRIQNEMNVKFTLDPCTSETNRLNTDTYFTKRTNGLIRSWENKIVFMNPPYSRGNIDLWTEKARREAFSNVNTVVVGLLPLRTAKWFRLNILPYSKIVKNLRAWYKLKHGECGIYFLERRVNFVHPNPRIEINNSPNFDSILAIWV